MALIEPEHRLTVGEFLAGWLEGKKAGGFKPASIISWGQTTDELTALIGARPVGTLTHTDGEAYRTAMQARRLRLTTIHKRLGQARQMFEDAVRLGHLAANPWRHVRQRSGDVAERRAYVPVADAERVIEHGPNVWWKLLVALARFGGLRIPSEAFSLTWGDADWERGRLSVPNPKTEHLGKGHRVIPLFPLLRPHLEAAFGHAEEGAEFVFPDEYRKRARGERGWGGANMRTQFGKIVRRAGVEPWPRLWHSLRASCESDLAQSFPLATVTKWLGNTASVALRHYIDATESAFEKGREWTPATGGAQSGAPAARKAAQQVHAGGRTETQPAGESAEKQGGFASPRGSAQFAAVSGTGVQRGCIGIEPTAGVAHTRHRF